MNVRRAGEEDIPWLESELLEFSQSIGTKHPLFPADESYRRETLLSLMRDHLFLIYQPEHFPLPVGLIAGVVIPHMLNPDLRVLHELLWWVSPKHRGISRAGIVLLDAFVAWGKDNCQWVYFSIHRTTEVSERSMSRLGFRPEQTQYLLEV